MIEEYIIRKLVEIRETIENKKVKFEIPEGLKYLIPRIKEIYIDAVFSGENVYGSCDVDTGDEYDIIVHVGHAKIPNIRYPNNIIFVEPRIMVSEKVLSLTTSVPYKKIGLGATIEFIDCLESLKKILLEYDKECYVGAGSSRVAYPGHILGCNYSSLKSIIDRVDCFLILASGEFHPLGAYLVTKKPTYYFNPLLGRIETVEEKNFMKRRFGKIVKAQEADSFGILLSKKIGQRREKLAMYINELVNSASLTSYIFEINDITSEKLMNLPVDVVVNTCCPRITYDEDFQKKCGKVIVSPQEVEIALRVRKWEEYLIDEI